MSESKKSSKRKALEVETESKTASMWTPEVGSTIGAEAEKTVRRMALKKNRKLKKAAAAEESLNLMMASASTKRFIAALDMSPRSPALCLIDRNAVDHVTEGLAPFIALQPIRAIIADYFGPLVLYRLLGFAQTGRQLVAAKALRPRPWTDNETKVEAEMRIQLHKAPTEFQHNAERFDITTSQIMSVLMSVPANNLIVIVEAYAYHLVQSSSITALAELGGVIRHKLFEARIEVHEVSPTAIKKWFTGSGAATKRDMFARFKSLTSVPLDTMIPGSFNIDVPCPHQDLVDAFASAYGLHRRSLALLAPPLPSSSKRPAKRVKK
jgi:Holliday junction resolvasome RuvABC endonuclease subunit